MRAERSLRSRTHIFSADAVCQRAGPRDVMVASSDGPGGGRARGGARRSHLIELELTPDPADDSRRGPQDVERAHDHGGCTGLADGNIADRIASLHRRCAIALGSYAGPMACGGCFTQSSAGMSAVKRLCSDKLGSKALVGAAGPAKHHSGADGADAARCPQLLCCELPALAVQS